VWGVPRETEVEAGLEAGLEVVVLIVRFVAVHLVPTSPEPWEVVPDKARDPMSGQPAPGEIRQDVEPAPGEIRREEERDVETMHPQIAREIGVIPKHNTDCGGYCETKTKNNWPKGEK